jgi:rhodanese-related sulfurtransferase
MRKVVLLMLAVFIIASCATGKGAPRIAKDDVKAKIGAADVVLLDVRSDADWDKSTEKIAGAKRVDPKNIDSWIGTLPKDKDIILYCA